MIRFNKDLNLHIIALTASFSFLFTATVYSSSDSPSKDFLRIPVGTKITDERLQKVTRDNKSAQELYKGLNLTYKESYAIAAEYPHLEPRVMLGVEGDIITELINPGLHGLSQEDIENMANRFVIGPSVNYKEALKLSEGKAYPCFQLASHYRKPYYVLPGNGIVITLSNGEKKRIRYVGYLGGGLVFSKEEKRRRYYTEEPIIEQTFGRGVINKSETNLGLANGGTTQRRFVILKEMADKGETEVPLFLLVSRLRTLRDLWGREVQVSDVEKEGAIIPGQSPVVALIGYEGLETMQDLDLISSVHNLRKAVDRNKEHARQKEGMEHVFSDKEFLNWFSEKLGKRLSRLINLGIERGNISPQNMTFFEITDFDIAHVSKIEDLKKEGYEDDKIWETVLFEHFFQGYVTLSFTFKLFSEKLGGGGW